MIVMFSYVSGLSLLVSTLLLHINDAKAIHNVDRIFNSIHSSMRQWGSSPNHNSVSFFRAEVPRGVLLHHGASNTDRVQGMEWLAFEPEHALNFAFKLCDVDKDFVAEDVLSMSPRWWLWQAATDIFRVVKSDQEIISESPGPQPLPLPCLKPGWIHTYAPIRSLNLLYIDGTSAATSNRGTLDSQDFVLLRNKSKGSEPREPMDELNRARDLCELAQDDLEGKVDGFIRMEHGFEIILCNFSLLEVVSILGSTRDAINPGPLGHHELDEFSFLRAVTSRYFGIGGQRVHVDYDSFVTAYKHPEIDLWSNDSEQPRLNKISDAAAFNLLEEVKRLVLSDNTSVEGRIDWQSIADRYVQRYARPIQNLISPAFHSAKAVHKEIHRLFQPYLDRTLTDRDAAIKRCREAYIPAHLVGSPSPSMGQQVVEQGANRLCSGLYGVLMERNVLELQKSRLQTIMKTLRWTTWKDCQPACDLNEICFTAIWPFGTQEDHDKPSCLNATSIRQRYGYWD